jgi:hypothetical protein
MYTAIRRQENSPEDRVARDVIRREADTNDQLVRLVQQHDGHLKDEQQQAFGDQRAQCAAVEQSQLWPEERLLAAEQIDQVDQPH